MATPSQTLHLGAHDVVVTHPDKVYFPQAGITKLQIAQYYLEVAEQVLRAVGGRPMVLKRYVHGTEGEPFFQKRAPKTRPAFIDTATFHYPSGGSADEVVVRDRSGLAWLVNLGCVEMHVHPVRADDLDHPDELRVDLDPGPGVDWRQVVQVAEVVHETLDAAGLVGWPKTSGSRGVHIWVRIERRWGFSDVRRAGLALAREVERRAPKLATSVWMKTERHGVLIDYNQNARDRTTASAYSVRAVPDARVSMPLSWDELSLCNPADFTLRTVPALVKSRGDAHARIDERAFSLDSLLALADGQEPRKTVKAPRKSMVLIVARAAHKADALAGLELWRQRHPQAATFLVAEDIIVDALRGKSSPWYRVRVNLRHVPEALRPAAEPPHPDYDPTDGAGPDAARTNGHR